MATIYNLRASNNATFHWTRDLTPFAAIYTIANATIRMMARVYPDAPDPPVYEWSTGAASGGLVTFNATTNLAVFTAPLSDVEAMPCDLIYDARLEFAGGPVVPLFGGRLSFAPGVTRLMGESSASGVSGMGDTVSVTGETSTSPVPLPLSLSAAVAAVAPAAIVATLAGLTSAQLAPLAQALLASLPAYSGAGAAPVPTGEVFVDQSGFVVRAQ